MLACFQTEKTKKSIPILLILQTDFAGWLAKQPPAIKNWLAATRFRGDVGGMQFIPDSSGKMSKVIHCLSKNKSLWDVGGLPFSLPEGDYHFENEPAELEQLAIGWGLGAYQFTRYKKATRAPAKLFLPQSIVKAVIDCVEPLYLVRDLINTPTEDMGPTEFAKIVVNKSKKYRANLKQIIGSDLLKKNYASIYTVGRASDDPPRLLDFRYGNKKHFRLTLVGKGVCFDSGGLDIKPSSAMFLMKKDMAGGAHVLGLADMIMRAKLPIHLRVLIPVVENVISGNAYRPGDVIKSRKGITIEIGNTDAEGRVILADALTEAASEKPDLIIDIATLTGAARVALGTELPAVFSNNDGIMQKVIQSANLVLDPMWQLPLYEPYRDSINSAIADITNSGLDSYGGAITAALFLKEFVPDDIPWLHFDLMAWNLRPRPGRPAGGEAMVLRGLFHYLAQISV